MSADKPATATAAPSSKRKLARALLDHASDGTTIALTALAPDPQNARTHTATNLSMIAAALTEVGAARSIVVDENGRVLAGEGVMTAAKKAGITHVRIIDTDGRTLVAVRRKGLTPQAKARLALFDNRSSDLSGWNLDVVAKLRDQGIDLTGLWTVDQLATKLRANDPDAGAAQIGGLAYRVIVDCRDEKHQAELLERFEKEGLECRPLIS